MTLTQGAAGTHEATGFGPAHRACCAEPGERPVPIERMSMLSNQASVALLGPDARLLWFCHPEPDSNALFAEVLGGRRAGVFAIAPAHGRMPLGQRYLPGTMTVRTRWSRLEVTDYLSHDTGPGRTDLVRVIEGSTPVEVEFAPRPDFGRAPVRIVAEDDGLRVHGADFPLVLRSPGVRWHIGSEDGHDTARATLEPVEGAPVVLELRCGTDSLTAHPVPEIRRRTRTESEWSDWLAGVDLPRTQSDLVARSALTLRGLCTPTGGVMAAATTSLPEEIGGV
ncbi:trehalase-like domain-containing protein, partial [Nocardiopsis sp. NPDC007018]|uniref:trehalase-like domain-containing protein n=1 Tax=Nocardiopsis sp. NPDC007018 TaxID=3155721 RepID=UPI00340F3C88